MIYSDKDFKNAAPPRIMGADSEYTTALPGNHFDIAGHMGPVVGYPIESKVWLENGGMLVPDMGLMEHAIPEVATARDALLYIRAGDELVRTVVASLANALQRPTVVMKRSGFDTVSIEKDGEEIVLSARDTAGFHEHYTTGKRFISFAEFKSGNYDALALTSYQTTRAVWAGAGLVANDGFELSQKTDGINFLKTSKSSLHGHKSPFISSLASAVPSVELRTGDANISDYVEQIKFAFTSLVLRMIEHGVFSEDLLISVDDLNEAFRQTARRKNIRTRGGILSAETHQKRIAEHALDFANELGGVPAEEIAAAEAVITLCTEIAQLGPNLEGASMLADRLDWAAKLTQIQRRTSEPITTKNLDAVNVDLRWEDLGPNGIGKKWFRPHRLVSDEEIASAQLLPPATRAMGRIAWVKDVLSENGSLTYLSWESGASNRDPYFQRDPYNPVF